MINGGCSKNASELLCHYRFYSHMMFMYVCTFQSLATVYPGQFKAQEVFEQLLVNLKNADNEVVLMDLKILAKTGQCTNTIMISLQTVTSI